MKNSLLIFTICISTLVSAQNKKLTVQTQVGGAMMRFSLFQQQANNSFSLLKEVDEDSGNWVFDSLSDGIYRVHVKISYNKYLPTWYPSAPIWDLSQNITLNSDSQGVIVNMIPNLAVTGPATIMGLLYEGILKTQGEPLKDTRVVINDSNDVFVKMVSTNDSGRFTASDLPVGTYKLLVDIINVSTANPKVVVLDSANLTSTVDLTVSKTGTVSTSINKRAVQNGFQLTISPNPAHNFIRCNLDGALTIIDVNGKLIWNGKVTSTDYISIEHLQNGLYTASFCEMRTAKIVSTKFIKQ